MNARQKTLMALVAVATLAALAATFTVRAELLSHGPDQAGSRVLLFDSQPPAGFMVCAKGEREAYRRSTADNKTGIFGCWRRVKAGVEVRWESGTKSTIKAADLVNCAPGSLAAYRCIKGGR